MHFNYAIHSDHDRSAPGHNLDLEISTKQKEILYHSSRQNESIVATQTGETKF